MAVAADTSKILKHLECTICLEKFDNPKELTCRHVFCKGCLDKIVEFDDDGEGSIKCPNKCNQITIIEESKTANDLYSSFYLNNILEELHVNDERFLDETMKCGTNCCEKKMSSFCIQCKQFLCRSCTSKHDTEHTNHSITLDKDNALQVVCDVHRTICEYTCCDDDLVCIYCINRDHAMHNFKSLEEQVQRIRTNIVREINNLQALPKIISSTKNSISTSKRQLEKNLRYRKVKCLTNYVTLLNEEEKIICKQFDALALTHQRDFQIKKSAESLEESLKRTNVELALLKKNILEGMSQDRSPLTFPVRTVSLTDIKYLDSNPLGKMLFFVSNVETNEFNDRSGFPFVDSDADKEDEAISNFTKKLEDGWLTSSFLTTDTVDAVVTDEVVENVQPVKNIYKSILEDVAEARIAIQLAKETISPQIENVIPQVEEKPECVRLYERSGFRYVEGMIRSGDLNTLKVLISKMPEILTMHGGDWDGTPTIIAAQYNKLEILKFLLTIVDGNDRDRDGDSFLHHAAFYGAKECAKWLCESRHSHLLEAKNRHGRTPLYWAVYKGEPAIVKLLCEYGADIDVRDTSGETPYDLAKRSFNRGGCKKAIEDAYRQKGRLHGL